MNLAQAKEACVAYWSDSHIGDEWDVGQAVEHIEKMRASKTWAELQTLVGTEIFDDVLLAN